MAEKETCTPVEAADDGLNRPQEKETMPSPSTSTRTQVDEEEHAPQQQHNSLAHATTSEKVHPSRQSSDSYATDDSDHGEPDLEHEEAEETVPGREVDRQLSKVC